MKTGAFIQCISRTFGVAEPTAKQVVRELKDATPPLFSIGLRGRYSPDVTPRDAAHTIIALLGTDRPSKAVEAVNAFAPLTLDAEGGELPAEMTSYEVAPTLADFLEDVLSFKSYFLFADIFRLELRPEDRSAEVKYWALEAGTSKLRQFAFTQGYASREAAFKAFKADFDRSIIRTGRSVLFSQVTEVAAALKHD